MPNRRRYPFYSLWKEFDEMMAEMENRFSSMMESSRYLPSPGAPSRIMPALKGECSVDIREHGDEVIIVADMPGVEKGDIAIRLLSPNLLQIACERKQEIGEEQEEKGYYMRERIYGAMSRTIALPSDVSDEGTTATFKNGVLEIHLKKAVPEDIKEITIE